MLDLRPSEQAKLTPLLRYVGVVFHQLITASAERAELSLEDSQPKAEFQIRFWIQGQLHHMAQPPRHLFEPVIVILCNYASVAYYRKGALEGKIETSHPSSSWVLQSKDLRRCVVLFKTQQIEADQRRSALTNA